MHGALNSTASDQYKPIQSSESQQLMHELLTDPTRYRSHIERYAASVVVSVTYGRRVTDLSNDEVVDFNRDSMHYLTSIK